MKVSRRRARELALRGLYQWLLNASEAGNVLEELRAQEDFSDADQELLETLLRNVVSDADRLRETINPLLDRPISQLSPVEHAILLIAASEMRTQPGEPFRVIINEAVELAKRYGGTDGHKYVNGVLDKLAAELRPQEVSGRSQRDPS